MMWKRLLSWFFVFGVVFYSCNSVFAETTPQEERAKLFELGQVVVTATKTEHTLEDVPVKTVVITKEEIAETHAQTLQDVLRYLPGLQMSRNSGTWGNKGNVSIRGLDIRHTLILVDGHRVHGGHQDAVDIGAYPVQMIERIEIVKGPGSALYGSEAIGGVINIITKNPTKEPMVSVFGEAGSRNTHRVGFEAGVKPASFGGLLNYTYYHTDGVEKKYDEYDQHQVQATLSYDFSPDSLFNIKMLYGQQNIEYENREQARVGINPSWTWKPDDISSLKVWCSWFQYEHKTKDRKTNYDHDMYEVEVDYTRLLFDRHNVTIGGQFEKEERHDKGKKFNAHEETKSLFISDEIDFSSVIIVPALRTDSHDRWGEEYNPKLNVLYNATDRIKLRACVGRAFNAPSLAKLYGQWKMGPYLVLPNPDLKPEKSIGYEVGADIALTKRMNFDLTFFRNEVEYLIEPSITKPNPRPPWYLNWINVEEATTQGIETDFKANITDCFSLALGYTYLKACDETTKLDLARRPKHRLDLEAVYRLKDLGLSVVLNGEYVGKRFNDEENTEKLKDYTVWDLSVSKDFGKHAQAFIRLENIFDEDDVKDEYDLDGIRFMGGMKVKF